jgi:hypothetical protein
VVRRRILILRPHALTDLIKFVNTIYATILENSLAVATQSVLWYFFVFVFLTPHLFLTRCQKKTKITIPVSATAYVLCTVYWFSLSYIVYWFSLSYIVYWFSLSYIVYWFSPMELHHRENDCYV